MVMSNYSTVSGSFETGSWVKGSETQGEAACYPAWQLSGGGGMRGNLSAARSDGVNSYSSQSSQEFQAANVPAAVPHPAPPSNTLACSGPPPEPTAKPDGGDPTSDRLLCGIRCQLLSSRTCSARVGHGAEAAPNSFLLNKQLLSTCCVLVPGSGVTKVSESKRPALEGFTIQARKQKAGFTLQTAHSVKLMTAGESYREIMPQTLLILCWPKTLIKLVCRKSSVFDSSLILEF